MTFIPCRAKKVWTSTWQYHIVTHKGKHTCPAVRKPSPLPEYAATFQTDPRIKPTVKQSKLIMQAVRNDQPRSEIEEIAFDLSNEKQLRNIKQQIVSHSDIKEWYTLQQKCSSHFSLSVMDWYLQEKIHCASHNALLPNHWCGSIFDASTSISLHSYVHRISRVQTLRKQICVIFYQQTWRG